MGRILLAFVAMILLASILAISWRQPSILNAASKNPQKIVSLAPNITETLYALGSGHRIAGVTDFCRWPPEAAQKPKVGGHREANSEAILRLNPDLVIMPDDMPHFKKRLQDMGVKAMDFNSRSLSGFLKDVEKIGRVLGSQKLAGKLISEFSDMSRSEKKQYRPTILFGVVNPDILENGFGEMTVIGKNNFYDDIIAAAGGQNAYAGNIAYPRISLEAILRLNPDVLVLAAPFLQDKPRLKTRLLDMAALKGLKADKILILDDPGDTIPGPRSLNTLKKLRKAILTAGGAP